MLLRVSLGALTLCETFSGDRQQHKNNTKLLACRFSDLQEEETGVEHHCLW
jgi:hypothetical protein